MAKGPKMKTNRGAAKRFRLTSKGKVRRQRAYHSHLNTCKTTKQKRNFRKGALVDSGDEYRVKRMLCV